MEHLLKLSDLSAKEINDVLNLADQLKYESKHGIAHKKLKGKTLGMIFQKSSTRTRVSFEAGMYQLGGQALFLNSGDLQLGRGEPISDTARVLSRYLDAVMIRTFKQSDVEDLARFGTIPIINGLTDYAHPCQVLADLMTIREQKGSLKNLKLCYVGDGNNMANSLIVGCVKMGMRISLACPKGYYPDEKLVEWAGREGNIEITQELFKAAADADAVYTDVWASMGQEGEAETRKKAFKGYQVDRKLMEYAKSGAIVLHCLPAHRGEEISAEIMDDYAPVIFEEAENRLHAQKAILIKLLTGVDK
ncbi:MAG: ornithine carbamoyltransferase [Clostridiales bacterium]|jgi:ornithine carbamoyltransferase|nr:ornithine carbamoyltransferase [Clostridiales bacterium]